MILKFDSEAVRRRFLDRVEREREDIHRRCRASTVLPHVVATGLSPAQEEWLRERAGADRAFADARFETF